MQQKQKRRERKTEKDKIETRELKKEWKSRQQLYSEGPWLELPVTAAKDSSFLSPWSVIPTVSSLPTTSPTNCADAALNWAKGVVKMVGGRRLGTRRDAQVRTASIRIDLCSDVR